jgi:hypothetical protein
MVGDEPKNKIDNTEIYHTKRRRTCFSYGTGSNDFDTGKSIKRA